MRGKHFVHRIGATFAHFDDFAVSYYDVAMYATLFLGAILVLWQLRRGGYAWRRILEIVPLGAVGLVAGARLGHCLIYRPEIYLRQPLEMLVFWNGGHSSFGAAIGLALVLLVWSRLRRASVLDLLDRCTFQVALGILLIRIGNFFNSEIGGRPTDLPWAVRFMYFDGGNRLRHPCQLYEAALGLLLFAALFAVDRLAGKEQRRRGLLIGLTLSGYSLGRFFIDFTKEYRDPDPAVSALSMGQYLALAAFCFGVGILVYAFRKEQKGLSSPEDR